MRSAPEHDVRIPADLRVDVARPAAAEPPDDSSSEHLAALVARMHARAEDFVDRAVRRITANVDSYERDTTVARDDLWWSVYRNLQSVLLALSDQRLLTEEELAVRRELGARRAQQGMPVDDVMRAFRVGYTVLWEGLSQIAAQLGPQYAQALLEHAAHVWMTFDQVTSAVADAHRQAVEVKHVDRRRRALRFLDGLQRYPDEAAATEEMGRSLGLDPHGPFTVAVHDPGARATALGRDIVVIDQPDRVVVLSTCGGEPSRCEDTLAGVLQQQDAGHVGIGIMRQGLAGARQSLEDADAAARTAVALDAPLVMFRTEWLSCLALKHAPQLDVLVAPAVQTLENDEDLCATLDAFISADGSLATAGKKLFVHANTVAYRLRQFAQRTGIDPRTATGMALTQLALTYSRAAARPQSPNADWLRALPAY